MALAALFNEVLEMASHECQSLFVVGCRARVAGLLPLAQLRKEPGVQECPAADGDGRATGPRQHPLCIRNGAHVAIAYYRDRIHRFDDGADAIQIDGATEALSTRTAVNGYGRHAGLFELAGEKRRIHLRLVPSQ